MKFGKIVLAGMLMAILNVVWGWLTCGKLFNWIYRLEPTYIWKLPEEMPLLLGNITGVVFCILLALVYALIYKGLPGKGMVKGLSFGLFVWLVGTLPGTFGLGIFSVIAPQVVAYWIISGLVTDLWRGLVIAAIYKE